MRLICPNCGAQYEVGNDVIPDDGRDVQCSNCGHTWFESPANPSAEMEEDGIETPREQVAKVVPKPEPAPKPAQKASLAPRTDAASKPQPDRQETAASKSEAKTAGDAAPKSGDTPRKVAASQATPAADKPVPVAAATVPIAEPEPESEPAPPQQAQPRKQLDPSIADILREEAAREQAARQSETAGGLDHQGDLGLSDPVKPAAAPAQKPDPADVGRQRVDRLQGRASPVSSATTGNRKEMFPDIEEINSTLRNAADRDALPPLPTEAEEKARRSGWRGFLSMLALIAICGVIYVYASALAQMVPALEDPLTAYVEIVDSGRLWLDAQVQGMLGEATTGS